MERTAQVRTIEIPDTRPRMAPATARTDPFQILTAEHAILLRQLESARTAAARKGAASASLDMLRRFGEAFEIHRRREELGLYPVCERLFSGPDGVAGVLRDDHSGIEGAFRALAANGTAPTPADVDGFLERVRRHFAREEHILFPLMAAMLPGAESSNLARRLRRVAAD